MIDPESATRHAVIDKKTRRVLATGYFPAGPVNLDAEEVVPITDAQLVKLSEPGDKTIATDGTITIDTTAVDRQRAASAAEDQKSAAQAALLRQARPPSAVLVKVRDGTALTAAELQQVVRWLAIREIRDIIG